MRSSKFDQHFERTDRMVQRAQFTVGALAIGMLAFWFAAICAIAYVAWHFISKWW